MVSLQAVVCAFALASSGETVLLDFSADWCGPCRQMEPTVRQLAAQGYPIRQVNIDREQGLASQYGVSGIPCFVMLVDGREVDRVVGATSKPRLMQMLGKARAASTAPSMPTGSSLLSRGQSPDASAPRRSIRFPGLRSDPPLTATLPTSKSATFEPAATASTTATAAPNDALTAQLLAASVRLRIDDTNGHSVGSGTIIDARAGEALVLTCGHIFRDSQGKGRITIDLFGPGAPKGVEGQLIDFDLKTDLALVSMRPGVNVTAAPLAPTGFKIAANDPVINVGCDHGADPTARASRVTSLNKFLGPANIQVAGQPVEGRSGGGLFTADGRVIGVCNAADPADNEGLYAALETIHSELAKLGLTEMLTTAAPATALASSPRMPNSMPGVDQTSPLGQALAITGDAQALANDKILAAISAQESGTLDQVRRTAAGAEVICIVRSLNDPRAKSEIIVLDKASPAFLEQLAANRNQQPARNLTSLEVGAAPSPSGWTPKWK
jgi:thiol-disulfide isomerase/thioredoxin